MRRVCSGRPVKRVFSALGSQLERALTEGQWDAAVSALLTKDGGQRKFSDKLVGLADIRSAQERIQRLVAARAQEENWHHHQRMTRLTRILINEFAQLKRDEGWVDMNDLEQAARVMLSDPVLSGWVQQRLDARVRHLLVDEFQDTNPLQWQALHAWLSGYAGAGGGNAPGVFIVGDPKQSIYRFRRAEPQVLRAAERFVVEGLGGAAPQLRSHAPQCARRARCGQRGDAAGAGRRPVRGVSRSHHRVEGVGSVRHLPQIGREARVAAEVAANDNWRDSLVEPRELPEEHLVTLESRQAARWIARRLAQGVPPQHVMVMARRRKRLVALEDELRLLGVPAQQPEKTDLCEAPEVQDLVALLDVLVSPTHDLSLARALRSPLFSMPDDALVAMARAVRGARSQGQAPTWFELLKSADADLPPPLLDAGTTLARWKQWVDRMPPHDALDAIFHEGDVLARYAQSVPPALRDSVLANLRALLGAALEVGGGRYVTPYAFVRAMRAGGVRAPSVRQAGRPSNCSRCTVPKGWRRRWWCCSIPMAPAARTQTMGMLVDWPGESATPRRFAFLASESRPPACCKDTLEVEKQARQREELNGLYVAMTRARSELVVSSVAPHVPAQGSWWRRLQSLCQAIPEDELAWDARGRGARITRPCVWRWCRRGWGRARRRLPRRSRRRRTRPTRNSVRPCTACWNAGPWAR